MRRLVVCADGTWNHPKDDASGAEQSTNVVKLSRAIRRTDHEGVSQITRYVAGVGTGGLVDHVSGGITGAGLDENILEAYRFLVQNFEPGDELYFFGFSRGAYTVRSLSGLIRNSGLLRPEFANREREAFALYRDRDPSAHPNADESRAFRERYSHEPSVKCIGVWDTVGALGLPVGVFAKRISRKRHAFHNVTLSSRVENAFHALAIDERRKAFRPTLWEQPIGDMGTNWLEQAWFAGAHSNVGGGYPDSGLSDVALKWMAERVTDRTPLEFDAERLASVMRPAPGGRLYDSMRPIFRVTGTLEREIHAAAQENIERGVNTWEYVHESAKHRQDLGTDAVPDAYNPENLRRYLSRTMPAGPWVWPAIREPQREAVLGIYS